METMKAKTLQPLTWCLTALLAVLPATLAAQSASSASTSAEVDALKTQLVEQQKQIDMLKLALEDQKKLLEHISNATPAAGAPAAGSSSSAQDNQNFTLPSKTLGQVASATPVIPPAAPAPVPVPRSVLAAAQRQPLRPAIPAKRLSTPPMSHRICASAVSAWSPSGLWTRPSWTET